VACLDVFLGERRGRQTIGTVALKRMKNRRGSVAGIYIYELRQYFNHGKALVRCLERKNFLLSTKESPYKY
jgi:hypothetical protein